MLRELVAGRLQLPLEELRGAPAVEDVRHRDEKRAGALLYKEGEDRGNLVFVDAEENSNVRENGEKIPDKDSVVLNKQSMNV